VYPTCHYVIIVSVILLWLKCTTDFAVIAHIQFTFSNLFLFLNSLNDITALKLHLLKFLVILSGLCWWSSLRWSCQSSFLYVTPLATTSQRLKQIVGIEGTDWFKSVPFDRSHFCLKQWVKSCILCTYQLVMMSLWDLSWDQFYSIQTPSGNMVFISTVMLISRSSVYLRSLRNWISNRNYMTVLEI